jgi:transcriptional regulator with XRE-family HTH domain
VRIQLRRARHDAGLSQTALAKKVGVSQQQIAALESPDANLTLSTLLKVAKALGHEVEIGISTSPAGNGRKLQRA